MADYIYSIKGLTKVHPPDKRIVTDLYLSFLPGAKIGVIGPNGMGKSSLLRIMAGEDEAFNGEVWLRPGATVGFVPQEPDIGKDRTVKDVVEEAVAPIKDVLARFEEVSMKLGEVTERRRDERAPRRAGESSRTKSTRRMAGTSTTTLELGDERAPPSTPAGQRALITSRAVRSDASRCAGCCSRGLTCCCSTSRPTTSTRRAWRGSSNTSRSYAGTIVAITHDRYFLDNVAEWILELDRGDAFPVQGQLHRVVGGEREAPRRSRRNEESARQRKIKSELEWVRSSPKARHAKSKARLQAFESLVVESGQARSATPTRSSFRRRPIVWATRSSRRKRVEQRPIGDKPPLRRSSTFRIPARRDRAGSSGRTVPARRRSSG